MNNPERPGNIEPIDRAGQRRFVEAAHALLPAPEPDVVDISDMPGWDDSEPSIFMSAQSAFEVDDRLVQLRDDQDASGHEVTVRVTALDVEPVSHATIRTTQTYSVSVTRGTSQYHETVNVMQNRNRKPDVTEPDVMRQVLAGYSLAEELGETVFTTEKLSAVLAILQKCGPHNQLRR